MDLVHTNITIEQDGNVWIARLEVDASSDYTKFYQVHAPSQTMLLETIRMLIGRRKNERH